ncbi:MAG TPA: metallophosphoesterase, partial [Candidatus Nanoarchaeia archaeon]|nr:metallophosphoesterase [Candidatus Nanoarchaeia archaeon]
MKIVAIGDPHGKLPKDLDNIIKRNNPDLIICVGDWAFTPEKPWLEESWKGIKRKFIDDSYKNSVDKVCSYGLPVLTLRGNMFM